MDLKKILENFFPKKQEQNKVVYLESNDNLVAEEELFLSDIIKRILNEIKKLSMSCPNQVENLVEKIACWYELIYPDYEISRLMPGFGQEKKDINDIMYNSVISNSDLKGNNESFRWNKIYGLDTFLSSLSSDELYYLKEPKYPSIVYVSLAHFHLDDNGFVIEGEELYRISDIKNPLNLIYINIKDASKFAKARSSEYYHKLKELGAITYDLIIEKSNKENWSKEELDYYLLHNRTVKDCIRILEENNYDKEKINEYKYVINEVQLYYEITHEKLYFKDNQFNGMHIKDVYKYLVDAKVFKNKLREIDDSIRAHDLLMQQRELILDVVLYRIIERGGKRVGPRRGLLFAKEFNRNIDIPMKYGYDFTDPGLRNFINQYIKFGGNIDLEIYEHPSFDEHFEYISDTISIRDILLSEKTYTNEELELYSSLARSLYNIIDSEQLRKEQAKELRIQKKINK